MRRGVVSPQSVSRSRAEVVQGVFRVFCGCVFPSYALLSDGQLSDTIY